MTVNPSLRVGHALVRGRAAASMRDRAATPKGFAQRTHLGPLPPRHGRVTFSPSCVGVTPWNDAVKRPHHEAAQRPHPTLLHSSPDAIASASNHEWVAGVQYLVEVTVH
jgi:hypothetical protein